MPGSLLMEQTRLTPSTIADSVRRQLQTDCHVGMLRPCSAETLDEVARDTVDALWGVSRIKLYVPLLALRDARDELRVAG